MNKKWILALGLITVLGIVGLAGCQPAQATLGDLSQINIGSQQQGIFVNGNGSVMAEPDIATLQLGIESQAPSVAEAQTAAQEAMDKVLASLKDNGIADKDIQTQYFNISKMTTFNRDTGEQEVTGYMVSNIVSAKVRTIDDTGNIIDDAVAAGGDLIRVNSISFSVEDTTAYVEQAREKALEDAKTKAEQLAQLAGVTLGKPTYISENSYYPAPVVQKSGLAVAEQAAAPDTSINPGELEISINLQITYDIK